MWVVHSCIEQHSRINNPDKTKGLTGTEAEELVEWAKSFESPQADHVERADGGRERYP